MTYEVSFSGSELHRHTICGDANRPNATLQIASTLKGFRQYHLTREDNSPGTIDDYSFGEIDEFERQ